MNYPYYYSQAPSDELKMVNGRKSAEQYSTLPNSRVLLMDSNCDRFYIKETDAAGVTSIKTYEFTEIDDTPQQPNYVTMEQLKEVLDGYEFTPKQQTTQLNAKTQF